MGEVIEQDELFQSLRRPKLVDEVVLQTFNLIESKRLKPGQKIPSERALCQTLGVNRSTLRQAIRTLAMMRVLEVRPGQGTFVVSDLKTASIETLVLKMHSDSGLAIADLENLFDLRTMVEVPSASKAASLITEKQVQELEEILENHKRQIECELPFADLDWRFHKEILEIAGNPLVLQLAQTYYLLLSGLYAGSEKNVVWRTSSLVNHQSILDALRARDPEAAGTAMRTHLNQTLEILKDHKQSE